MLGRQLSPKEHVHHKNGVTTDNRPENLEVLSCQDHHRIHHGWIRKDGEWFKTCPKCKRTMKADTSNFWHCWVGKTHALRSRCKECANEDRYAQIARRKAA